MGDKLSESSLKHKRGFSFLYSEFEKITKTLRESGQDLSKIKLVGKEGDV